jgi:RNA-directed DNA polymerase
MGLFKEKTTNGGKTSNWNLIDWNEVTRQVCDLQTRIVKAMKREDWKQVRSLQRLLTHSTAGKLLAVRQVTSNRGKRTPGVDGIRWNTPQAKYAAAETLSPKGYHAKPLRRVFIPKGHGKFRPLGIPTMFDRAMQALYKLALDPLAEYLADPNSYGFRKYRSVADAIAHCFTILARKGSAGWILEGDITSCFDEISHEWLCKHIPTDTQVLHAWLESGVLHDGVLQDTTAGTPQGGIISPTLCNLVLDGIEQRLEDYCQTQGKTYRKTHKIRFVRYADDFIITGDTREVLEQEIRPLLEQFFAERGLRLSDKKTKLTRIQDGFDFLGFHLQKFRGTLLITPSKSAIREVKGKIRHIIKTHKGASTTTLLKRLNPVIRGWAYAYRHVVSKRIFHTIDHYVRQRLWYWARRRHRNKSRAWVDHKYFRQVEGQSSLFSDGKGHTIFRMVTVVIRRHVKIRGDFNPYDPAWESYLEARRARRLPDAVQSIKRLKLWMRQGGRCPFCGGVLDGDRDDCGWSSFQVHHVVLVSQGGTEALKNLRLLHDVCHRQLHACHKEATVPVAA